MKQHTDRGGTIMRAVFAVIFVLAVGANVSAQDKALVEEIKKLDARVFKPDSADAK